MRAWYMFFAPNTRWIMNWLITLYQMLTEKIPRNSAGQGLVSCVIGWNHRQTIVADRRAHSSERFVRRPLPRFRSEPGCVRS